MAPVNVGKLQILYILRMYILRFAMVQFAHIQVTMMVYHIRICAANCSGPSCIVDIQLLAPLHYTLQSYVQNSVLICTIVHTVVIVNTLPL